MAEARAAGVSFSLRGEQIIARPRAALSPELAAEISSRRNEIIKALIPPEASGVSHQEWLLRLPLARFTEPPPAEPPPPPLEFGKPAGWSEAYPDRRRARVEAHFATFRHAAAKERREP